MSTVYGNDAVKDSNIKLELDEGGNEKGTRGLIKRINVLLIIAVVASVLAIIFMIVMIWSISSTRGHVPSPSAGDVDAAAALKSNMDLTADPCSDFYQYACGGWMKKHVIPDDTDSWSNFGILRDHTLTTIYNALNSLIDSKEKKDSSIETMLALYQSCMEPKDPEEDYISKKVDDIRNANSKKDALKIASELNTYIFYVAYVDPDVFDPSKNAIMVSQGALGMYLKSDYNDTKDEGKENKKVKDYKTYLRDLWGNLEKLGNDFDVNGTVDKMYDFETCVANNAMMSPTERRKKYENRTKLSYKDFKEKYQKNDLYIGTAFESRVSKPELIPDDVNVYFMEEYFKNLTDECMGVLSKNDDYKNYIATRYMVTYAAYGKKSWRDIEWDYASKVRDIKVKPAQWKTCQNLITKYLPEVVGRIFVEETFTKEAKKNSETMIKDIKAAFMEILPGLGWIDKETRTDASKKAESVTQKIGYPDWILTDVLNDYYKDVTGRELLSYIVSLEQIHTKKSFDEAGKPADKNKWYMSPATVNAYYNPSGNEMVFPAAILQPPFYKETYPTYVNYGAIGVVIGHELTHGFDDEGRKYGPTGKKEKWGTDEADKKFKEAANCLVNQYSDYKINDLNVDGELTLGENIADNGGVKQAFLAYKHWVDRNGKERELPGLDITNEQAFFLSYAQIWCQKKTANAFDTMIKSDPHSPGKFRVKGPLVNSADFTKAFKCNNTAPMNPDEKCEVW